MVLFSLPFAHGAFAQNDVRDAVVHLTVRYHDIENKELYCDYQHEGSAVFIDVLGTLATVRGVLIPDQNLLDECGSKNVRVVFARKGGRDGVMLGSYQPFPSLSNIVVLSPNSELEPIIPPTFCAQTGRSRDTLTALGYSIETVGLADSPVHISGSANGELGRENVISPSLRPGYAGGPVVDSGGSIIGLIQSSESDSLKRVVPIQSGVNDLSPFGVQLRSCATRDACEQKQPEIESCVANVVEEFSDRSFESAITSVRCPGGGCLFKSSDCNRRRSTALYQAPGGWVITEHSFDILSENEGSVGPVRVEQNDDGEAVVLSRTLQCHPSSRPGAGGGWISGRFTGMLRYLHIDQEREQARIICTQQICSP